MNKPKNQILIVDDEPDIREVLELTLGTHEPRNALGFKYR